MVILFDNKVLDATLSASSPDTSSPVSNLKHFFLKKLFKSTLATETVSIDFGEDVTVRAIYLGLTNAASIVLNLYDSSHNLLYTQSVLTTILASSFDAVDDVRYAEVVLATGTSAAVYLGTLALGDPDVLPDPLSDWLPGLLDNSESSRSADGQYMVNKVDPLRTLKASFKADSQDDFNEAYALFSALEGPVWVDAFEDNRERFAPMYATAEFSVDSREDGGSRGIYTYSVQITEAR